MSNKTTHALFRFLPLAMTKQSHNDCKSRDKRFNVRLQVFHHDQNQEQKQILQDRKFYICVNPYEGKSLLL